MIDRSAPLCYDPVVLARQRESIILSALMRGSFIALQDAVELTGASEATVRRDFARLEAAGRVRRHRGGVEISDGEGAPAGSGMAGRATGVHRSARELDAPLVSAPLEGRIALRDEAKRLIAERAAMLVEDGQTVFLDAGSTALALAGSLARVPVRVITNSYAAAAVLIEGGVARVVVTGGQIDRASGVIFSYVDDPVVESYPPDIAFLGAQGVDDRGVSNSDERLIRIERTAARLAARRVLIADSSKFGVRGRVRLCGLEEIDVVVTDAGLANEYEALLRRAGVRAIIVR